MKDINIKQSQININKLKEGLTYEGKKRLDNLIKDIHKSIKQAESENIKAMRLHLESLEPQKNNDITSLFMQGLGINAKMLFDLKYVEYEKQKGKMMVLCRCKWLKQFLTKYLPPKILCKILLINIISYYICQTFHKNYLSHFIAVLIITRAFI